MNNNITGIAASKGIAIAKAYRLIEPECTVVQSKITDAPAEIARFEEAISKSISELSILKEKVTAEQGAEKGLIFEAHITMLSDPEMIDMVKGKVTSEQVNAEYALKEVTDMFISMFEGMEDVYMRERAADIKDITKRATCHLLGVPLPNPGLINEEVIVVAHDLTPSDTAQLNREFVRGFTTDIGGRTSHSAIMARSLEIPAVVGTKEATKTIKNGDMLILDGLTGVVLVNPTETELTEYRAKLAAFVEEKQQLTSLKDEPTVSMDGHRVELVANIGTPNDLESVVNNGAEGVGLYRTEFLYMDASEMPSEEIQYEAYSKVLKGMGEKPVVVRTLDIGGDKELSYLEMQPEMNPFLGFRAIRLCLDREDIFRTQLRALLRASVHGNLKIMFPMIATLVEFRSAKAILLDEKEKLKVEGHAVSDEIEIGIMVEIPATAVLADQFAKEVDFFSIGTNDLIQYTMAADRMNERVSYLYQPYNPSILRLIKMVIDASHNAGKWTGMCGEMAGEELAVPLLLGLGLDEFSMSASSVLRARAIIKSLHKAEMEEMAREAIQMQTSEQVVELVKSKI